MKRLGPVAADWLPIVALATIAAAGSFTHIRDLAEASGQLGWMAWAVAVSIDLTCVMAARERQRDAKLGRVRKGWVSWPTVVLSGAVVLTLAANLATAQSSVWGWIMAATPAGAFLVAVSMLERRAGHGPPVETHQAASAEWTRVEPVASQEPAGELNAPPTEQAVDTGLRWNPEPAKEPVSAEPLLAFAQQVAADHHSSTGDVITVGGLRSRLGVAEPVAARLHDQLV